MAKRAFITTNRRTDNENSSQSIREQSIESVSNTGRATAPVVESVKASIPPTPAPESKPKQVPKPPVSKPVTSIAKPQTVTATPIVSKTPPAPVLTIKEPTESTEDARDTTKPGNAANNIKKGYMPSRNDTVLTSVNEQIDTTNNTVKYQEPKPVQSFIQIPKPKPSVPTAPIKTIQSVGGVKVNAPVAPPRPNLNVDVGIKLDVPKPNNVVEGPIFKNSRTIVRPDGVTEVLSKDGIVLEEIGVDGKIIVDPIKDAGFDVKNPPASMKALQAEFKQHIESGADASGQPFYVSEQTKAALVADGLGDKGNSLTAKEQAEKIKNSPWLLNSVGYQILQKDLIKKGLLDPSPEVDSKDKKKAKEKVVNVKQVQANLKPQDYVATIKEVLDANRIRVSLSYNDGVNLYGHKGEDQVSKKFKGFKVNYVKNNIQRYKTYVKVENEYYLVVNSQLGVDGNQRILKVKQPLTSDVELGEGFTFVEKRLPDYRDRVRLIPFEEQENNHIFLRLPNFNSVDNPINFQGTNYQTHTGILTNNTNVANDLERILTSDSLLSVQPNIDYQKTTTDLTIENDDTGFGNFVHFSNAESRLRNFKKKLQLIEGYTSTSSSLVSVTSSLSTIQGIEDKRQRVINSFDPYETYLYYESSSYSSGSNGLFHDTCWPKSSSLDSAGRQTNHILSSTNPLSISWFNTMIASASLYDQGNMNSLRNTLPEHIYADTDNNVFLEFMDMVGQYFDEIYSYVNRFTDINNRVEKISEGISKDVAIEYAKALGLDLYTGNDILVLPTYLLGKDNSGNALYESPQEEVTEKIWKRVLANLPFFIKAKGTERALKGLLNCYGIPSSILRVREYGGPDKGTRVSYEIKRKFTYALDFKAGQYIKVPWKSVNSLYPDTVEFRFRTPYSVGNSGSMTIVQKDNDWAISLQDNGGADDYGYLKFSISASDGTTEYITSSLQPFYNDDMWSVMLTRKSSSGAEHTTENASFTSSYELSAKQYDSGRQKILFETSESLSTPTSKFNTEFISSGDLYIGGNSSAFGTQFSGSLMEFRLWSEPLSQSVFDNHVRTPKAYNGNTYSSSYDELLFRLPLGDNNNWSSQPTASEVSYLNTYQGNITGSNINGFTSNFFRSIVDQEKMKVPNVGPNRRNATKIRIETNKIEKNLDGTQTLMVDKRRERSNDDFAPLDSNRLGIYFSPVDVVNEDIIYSIADFNFDDYIGNPNDEYEPNYKDLRHLRRQYFKRYSNSNNFWDYLRLLQYYDSSIFDTLLQLTPARAHTQTGILIEPSILERSKQVVSRKPEFDNRYYENAGHFGEGIKVTRYISGSDDNFFEVSGEYPYYESFINLAYFDTGSSLGFLNNRSIVKLDQIDKRSEYGTLYATASVTFGGTNTIFTETLQPIITASRLSEHNDEVIYFYSSSYSASVGPTLAYSSSFFRSDVESMAYSTPLYRVFVQGDILTINNSIDGEEPIIVNEVAPTVLKTQDSNISRLKIE